MLCTFKRCAVDPICQTQNFSPQPRFPLTHLDELNQELKNELLYTTYIIQNDVTWFISLLNCFHLNIAI